MLEEINSQINALENRYNILSAQKNELLEKYPDLIACYQGIEEALLTAIENGLSKDYYESLREGKILPDEENASSPNIKFLFLAKYYGHQKAKNQKDYETLSQRKSALKETMAKEDKEALDFLESQIESCIKTLRELQKGKSGLILKPVRDTEEIEIPNPITPEKPQTKKKLRVKK